MFRVFVMGSQRFLCVVFIVAYTISHATGQMGHSCSLAAVCAEGMTCRYGKCVCLPKHVQNDEGCFPEVRFGEKCLYSDQCYDYRQICLDTKTGMRCVCDKYHEYNYVTDQCTPRKNLTDMLIEQHHSEERIAKQSENIFFGVFIAGCIITSIGAVCVLVTFIYCFRMHITDKRLDRDVTALLAKSAEKGKVPLGNVTKKPDPDQISEHPVFHDAAMMVNIDMI